MEGAARSASQESSAGRLARRLLAMAGDPPVRLVLWNGDTVGPVEDPLATIHIRSRGTLARLLWNPDLHLGEAYTDGSIDVEGDLVALLEAVYRSRRRAAPLGPLRRGLLQAFDRRPANTVAGSRENIHHHYDIGNAFYRLWLDREMVYTCAYFPTQEVTLEAAQVAKMDHVCRKLRLRSGERVIEAGCGWGGFAMHAATHYGVDVRAFNISTEQVAWARERARELGVQDRVEFIQEDYRDITGRCDAFVSIGMLEHVGVEHYGELGGVIDRTLEPHGRGLIHSIGQIPGLPLNAWIVKHIFPGAYPPTLGEMTEIFRPWGMSVLDVENLRLHYALTLQHWLDRYEAAADQVRAMYDERFVRMWRFYLSGSIAAFRSGDLELFQVVFNRAGANDIPWTREHLYPLQG
jgi:cyclopropane-fatty-acyl-phospholipid synthase